MIAKFRKKSFFLGLHYRTLGTDHVVLYAQNILSGALDGLLFILSFLFNHWDGCLFNVCLVIDFPFSFLACLLDSKGFYHKRTAVVYFGFILEFRFDSLLLYWGVVTTLLGQRSCPGDLNIFHWYVFVCKLGTVRGTRPWLCFLFLLSRGVACYPYC